MKVYFILENNEVCSRYFGIERFQYCMKGWEREPRVSVGGVMDAWTGKGKCSRESRLWRGKARRRCVMSSKAPYVLQQIVANPCVCQDAKDHLLHHAANVTATTLPTFPTFLILFGKFCAMDSLWLLAITLPSLIAPLVVEADHANICAVPYRFVGRFPNSTAEISYSGKTRSQWIEIFRGSPIFSDIKLII